MQKPEAQRISYIPWDFNYHAKQRSSFILADMASVIKTGLDATSFFFICPADDIIAEQVICLLLCALVSCFLQPVYVIVHLDCAINYLA